MQRYPGRRFWVNDLDPFLSCFWVALASDPDRLVKTLNYYLAEFPSNRDKASLANWARTLVHETKGVERAALYYIMSKTSFSGMPFFGCSANGRKFNARGVQQLNAVGRMLRSVDLKVTDLDYADCLTDNPDVFTYFDPPYLIDCFLYGENGKMHRNFDHRRFAKAVNPLKSRWMAAQHMDAMPITPLRQSGVSFPSIGHYLRARSQADLHKRAQTLGGGVSDPRQPNTPNAFAVLLGGNGD